MRSMMRGFNTYFFTSKTKEFNDRCHSVLMDNDHWASSIASSPPTGLNFDFGGDKQPCLFTDVCQLTRRKLDPSASFEVKRRAILRSPMLESSCCYTHGKVCRLPEQIDFGVSGLPCTDFSTAGARLGKNGRTAAVYMNHSKFCRSRKVKLILLECVPALWLGLVWDKFGLG